MKDQGGIIADLKRVREDLQESGFGLTDPEFEQALTASRRKVKVKGMKEEYLPYLLPDVIREMVLSREINNITASVMADCRI